MVAGGGGTLGSGVAIQETLKRVACGLIPLKTLVRHEGRCSKVFGSGHKRFSGDLSGNRGCVEQWGGW